MAVWVLWSCGEGGHRLSNLPSPERVRGWVVDWFCLLMENPSRGDGRREWEVLFTKGKTPPQIPEGPGTSSPFYIVSLPQW